jgi:hypothetical protein
MLLPVSEEEAAACRQLLVEAVCLDPNDPVNPNDLLCNEFAGACPSP